MAPKKTTVKEKVKPKSKAKKQETAKKQVDKEDATPRGKYYDAHCAFEAEDVDMVGKTKSPSLKASQSTDEEQEMDAIAAEMEAELEGKLEAERETDKQSRTENDVEDAKADATTACQASAKTTEGENKPCESSAKITAPPSTPAPAVDADDAPLMAPAADTDKAIAAAAAPATPPATAPATATAKAPVTAADVDKTAATATTGTEEDVRIPVVKKEDHSAVPVEEGREEDERGEWREEGKKGEWKEEEKKGEWKEGEKKGEWEEDKKRDEWKGNEKNDWEDDEKKNGWKDDEKEWKGDEKKEWKGDKEKEWKGDEEKEWKGDKKKEWKGDEKNNEATPMEDGTAEKAGEGVKKEDDTDVVMEVNKEESGDLPSEEEDDALMHDFFGDFEEKTTDADAKKEVTKKPNEVQAKKEGDMDTVPATDARESVDQWKPNDWKSKVKEDWNETTKVQETADADEAPVRAEVKEEKTSDWDAKGNEWETKKDTTDWNTATKQERNETTKDEDTADVHKAPAEVKKEEEANDWDAKGNEWETKKDTSDWTATKKQEWNETTKDEDTTDVHKAPAEVKKEEEASDWDAKGNDWNEETKDEVKHEEEEEREDSEDRVEIEEDEDGESIEIHVKHIKYDDAAGQLWDMKGPIEGAVSNAELTLKKNSVIVCGVLESVTFIEAYLKATQLTTSGEKVPKAVLQPAIAAKHCTVRRFRTDDANQFKIPNLGKMAKKIKPNVLIFELEEEEDGDKKNAVKKEQDVEEKQSGGSSSSWGDNKDWKSDKNDWKADDNDWNTDKKDWKSDNDWNKTETNEETYVTIAFCSAEPVDRWMVDLMWMRFYEMDHPGHWRETAGSEDHALDEFAYILEAKDNAGRAIGKGGELIKRIERIFGARGYAKLIGEKGTSLCACVGDSEEARNTVVAFMRSLLEYQPPTLGSSRTVEASVVDQMKRLPHEEVVLANTIPTKNIETNVEGVFVYEVSANSADGESDTDWSVVQKKATIESRDPADGDTWEHGTFLELTMRDEDGFPMIKLELSPGFPILRKCSDVRLKQQRIVIFGENQDARTKALELCKEYDADPSLFESKGSWGGGKTEWGAKKADSGDWGAKKADNDWGAKKDKSSDWAAKNDWSKDESSGWNKRQLEDDGEKNDWKKKKW